MVSESWKIACDIRERVTKLNFVAVVLKNTPRGSQMTVFLLYNLGQSPYSLKLFGKDRGYLRGLGACGSRRGDECLLRHEAAAFSL